MKIEKITNFKYKASDDSGIVEFGIGYSSKDVIGINIKYIAIYDDIDDKITATAKLISDTIYDFVDRYKNHDLIIDSYVWVDSDEKEKSIIEKISSYYTELEKDFDEFPVHISRPIIISSTFKLITSLDEEDKELIDANMYEPCVKLSDKGYFTEFSCEGHDDEIVYIIDENENGDQYLYALIVGAYISFVNEVEFDSLPEHWNFDETFGLSTIRSEKSILLRPVTDSEVSIDGTRALNASDIEDHDNTIKIFNEYKEAYLKSLNDWIETLPQLDKPLIKKGVHIIKRDE